jgi:N-acetylneuraminic acid mutarotase
MINNYLKILISPGIIYSLFLDFYKSIKKSDLKSRRKKKEITNKYFNIPLWIFY